MKSIDSPIQQGPVFIRATQAHPNITNVCAVWRPGPVIPGSVRGTTGPSIMLSAAEDVHLIYGVVRSYNGETGLMCSYDAPGKKLILDKTLLLPEGDYVYLEIDLDPSTGQVVFWANDKGLDVGVLAGFKDGAQQAAWRSVASPDAHLMSGQFTDCAIATEKGWMAAKMHDNNLTRRNLQAHHQATIVSANTLSFGDKRSLA